MLQETCKYYKMGNYNEVAFVCVDVTELLTNGREKPIMDMSPPPSSPSSDSCSGSSDPPSPIAFDDMDTGKCRNL